MPLELTSLAVGAVFSALAAPPVNDAYAELRKTWSRLRSQDSPAAKALDRAVRHAWQGFEGSLRSFCVFDPPAEHRLKSFAEDLRFAETFAQLLYRPPDDIDLSALRAALLEHGPDGVDAEVFATAWKAAVHRFRIGIAENPELQSLVEQTSDLRREGREVEELRQLSEINQKLSQLVKPLVAPELGSPEVRDYRETVYREHRYADIRGLFRKEGEPVAAGIELREVFVETALARHREIVKEIEEEEEERRPAQVFGEIYLAEPKRVDEVASVASVLARQPLVVILGVPGSGKSTLLKAITLSLCQPADSEPLLDTGVDSDLVPLYLPLKEYATKLRNQPNTKLESFFLGRFRSVLPAVEKLLDDGRCRLLLDGLDEVLDVNHRRWVVDEVWRLHARFGRNRFVLTSRHYGYRSNPLPGPAECWELQPFDEQAIRRFFRGWFVALSRIGGEAGATEDPVGRADALTEEVIERPRLLEMAENPLLCTLIVLVHRLRSGRLPHRRVKFLEHAAKTLISEWPTWRRVGGDPEAVELPDPEVLERAVAEVAWRALTELGTREIPKPVLEAWLGGYLEHQASWPAAEARKAAQNLIESLRDQLGILVDAGGDQYQFVHLHLHEYFAAYFVRDRLGEELSGQVLRHYLHAPGWEEVLRLLVSGATQAQANAWLSGLLDQPTHEHEPRLRRDLGFACRCLGDLTQVGPELRERIQELVIEAMKDRDTPTRRRLSRDAIGLGRSRPILQVMVELLGEPSAEAVEYFVQVGAVDADTRAAVARRFDDDDPFVRRTAVQYFARVGADDADTRATVARRLDDDAPSVRRTAVEYFARVGADDADTRATVASRLYDDAPIVRHMALDYFARVADDADTRAAFARRLDDDDPIVRKTAVEYFARVGADDANTLAAVARRLNDDNSSVRSTAVEYFARVEADDADTRAAIVRRFDDDDPSVRSTAAEYFARVEADDAETQATIARQLDDDNPFVRRMAVQYFARVGADDTDTRATLARRLDDDDPFVRIITVIHLAQVGADDADTRAAVARRLDDDDSSVRTTAVLYFVQVGADDAGTRAAFTRRLNDDEPYVRRTAVLYFAQLGADDADIRAAVAQELYDDDLFIRMFAVLYFDRVGLRDLASSVFQAFPELTSRTPMSTCQDLSRQIGRAAATDPALRRDLLERGGSTFRFHMDLALEELALAEDQERRKAHPLVIPELRSR